MSLQSYDDYQFTCRICGTTPYKRLCECGSEFGEHAVDHPHAHVPDVDTPEDHPQCVAFERDTSLHQRVL